MGGVALLHPRDALKNHFVKQPLISSPLHMKQHHQQPRTTTNNHRRKKNSPSSPVPNKTMVNKISPAPLMGQVKILKRGQDLDLDLPPPTATVKTTSDRVYDVAKAVETGGNDRIGVDLDASRVTDHWGPEPEILSKQINVLSGFYAGSAIVSSPPPSSVPLPGFFSKNVSNNKHATNDLLRILRLNLA